MRLSSLIVVASALAAAGCTSVAPPDNTFAFHPGTGTVQQVRQARVAIPGGTTPKTALENMVRPRWMDGYQLSLRMDDGTAQAITQDSNEFQPGDRVQITQEGRVLKVPTAQASASAAGASSAWRPGTGTIQSVAPTGTSAQQVSLAMDDGTKQVVTLQGATVQPGEHVTLTADGHMVRP
jgi:outer membrane lipoprotein SlyB